MAVLDEQRGRAVTTQNLQKAFRHLQFSRLVNQHGLVSVQRFFIYAERGLAKKRVTVWIYEDRLNIEYKHTLMARYDCKLTRKHPQLTSISNPEIYETNFDSPQLELFVLDDSQWFKVIQRPPFAPRQARSGPLAEQLLLWSTELAVFLWFWLS